MKRMIQILPVAGVIFAASATVIAEPQSDVLSSIIEPDVEDFAMAPSAIAAAGEPLEFCGICNEWEGEQGQPDTHWFTHYPEIECDPGSIGPEQSCRECKGSGATHLFCHESPDVAGLCGTHDGCENQNLVAAVDGIIESGQHRSSIRTELRALRYSKPSGFKTVSEPYALAVLDCHGNVVKRWRAGIEIPAEAIAGFDLN